MHCDGEVSEQNMAACSTYETSEAKTVKYLAYSYSILLPILGTPRACDFSPNATEGSPVSLQPPKTNRLSSQRHSFQIFQSFKRRYHKVQQLAPLFFFPTLLTTPYYSLVLLTQYSVLDLPFPSPSPLVSLLVDRPAVNAERVVVSSPFVRSHRSHRLRHR